MNLKTALTQIAACSALALCAGAAQADPYNFVITGDYAASWQMESSPTPDDSADGFRFFVWGHPGNFPGASAGFADVIFYSSNAGGGLEIYDNGAGLSLISTMSEQLYTGTEATPTFKLGSFAMTGFGSGEYTLTISSAVAVPEPASLALMLGGLGIVAWLAARRSKA